MAEFVEHADHRMKRVRHLKCASGAYMRLEDLVKALDGNGRPPGRVVFGEGARTECGVLLVAVCVLFSAVWSC